MREDQELRDVLWPSAVTAAVIGILAVVYLGTGREMARAWWQDEYAAHGLLVPIYSGLVMWRERERLRRIRRVERLEWPAILVSLAALAVARSSESILLQGLSLVGAIALVIWWVGGTERLKAVAFPVGFLLLMIPLPREVTSSVGQQLQHFVADSTGAVLAGVGMIAHQEGLRIEMARGTLEIAEGCNGLRFLLAMLTVSVAFAHATQPGVWRKLVLIAAAGPLAVGANVVRVTAVAVAFQYVGSEWASGARHHLIGKAVWVLALLALVAFGMVLRKVGRIGGDSGAIERRLQTPRVALGAEAGGVR